MFETAAALIIMAWASESGSSELRSLASNLFVGTIVVSAAYYAILWSKDGNCECVCTGCRRTHYTAGLRK
jgi:hypothetical protein